MRTGPALKSPIATTKLLMLAMMKKDFTGIEFIKIMDAKGRGNRTGMEFQKKQLKELFAKGGAFHGLGGQYAAIKGCRKKQYLRSQEGAERRRDKAIEQGHYKEAWVYKCKHCPGWHITTDPNEGRKGK